MSIVPRPAESLDDDGFLVFAEDAAEGVGDFADGGVGFDGGEDGGEQIFGGGGAACEFGEGGLWCARNHASGAKALQARDLVALDLLFDAEGGDGALFFRVEIIHADDDLLFFFDGALEIRRRLFEFRPGRSRIRWRAAFHRAGRPWRRSLSM